MKEKRSYVLSPEVLEERRLRHERVLQTYEEIGETMASAVLEGGQTEEWVWETIAPLGLYERWMVKKWISRYRYLNRPRLRWRAGASKRAAQRRLKEERRIEEARRRARPE